MEASLIISVAFLTGKPSFCIQNSFLSFSVTVFLFVLWHYMKTPMLNTSVNCKPKLMYYNMYGGIV